MRTPGSDLQEITIDAPEGKTIRAVVAWPDGPGPFPVVVVLHGTLGHSQRFVQLAQDLAKNGFIAVAGCWFEGSHREGRSDPRDFIGCPNGPRFTGISLEAGKNVQALIEGAKSLQGATDQLGLWGQSRGASIALVVASTSEEVQAVVSSAAAYYELENLVPGEVLPITFISDLDAPVLILHGTADEKTPVQHARDYETALRELGKTYEAHYYEDGPHGIALKPLYREDAFRRTVEFFKENLDR